MLELTVTQIAARLGVVERTAHRYIQKGTIAVQPGRNKRYYLVEETELERCSEALRDDDFSLLYEQVQRLEKRLDALEQGKKRKPTSQSANSLWIGSEHHSE